VTEKPDIVLGELVWYYHEFSREFKEMVVIPISDAHIGDPLFSLRHLDRTIGLIRDTPNAITLLNGDLCNTIIKASPGNIYSQLKTPQDQRDYVIGKLMPIKDKILGVVIGNHEERILNATGIDICKDIASALGVPYRPEGLLHRVVFGGGNSGHPEKPYSYMIYHTHGYGGARTKGAKDTKLQRIAMYLDADLYFMSHDHTVSAWPEVSLESDPRSHIDPRTGFRVGCVREKLKKLVKTNAYIKWGGYGEMRGFAPTSLEAPIARLSGEGKPNIRIEV